MFFKKGLIFFLVAIFLFFIFFGDAGAENKRVVLLYYLNAKIVLQEFPFEPEKAVFPVYREIHQSTTLIRDTIELLIEGELKKEEEELGFITEFPHPGFRLVGLDLKKDGTLVLEFTEIFGFTTGGAARMLVRQEQIIKTALQFKEVKSVEFYPESLFQP
jgi:spore germination protein GerM